MSLWKTDREGRKYGQKVHEGWKGKMQQGDGHNGEIDRTFEKNGKVIENVASDVMTREETFYN